MLINELQTQLIRGLGKVENVHSPENLLREAKTISDRGPSGRRVLAVRHLSGNRLQICP
jgi:hypothetical protein